MPATPGIRGSCLAPAQVDVTSNNTTFVNTGLTIPNYAKPGGTGSVNFWFRVMLFFQSQGAGGLRFRFFNTSVTMTAQRQHFDVDAAAMTFVVVTSGTATQNFIPVGGSPQFMIFEGVGSFVANSQAVDFRFCQAVSDPAATSVFPRSYVEYVSLTS